MSPSMEFFYVGIRGLHCYVVKLRLTLFIRSVGPCGGYVLYFVYLSITALIAPSGVIAFMLTYVYFIGLRLSQPLKLRIHHTYMFFLF